MAYTSITFADTAKDPSGVPIPYAVVVVYPRVGFANGGTTTNAASAVATAAGAFTMSVNATNDAGTAPIDPDLGATDSSYHVLVFDPRSGEHVYDSDVTIPNSPTTIGLTGLVPI